jgi:hypothetical protein
MARLRSSAVLQRGALLNSPSLNVCEESVGCAGVDHVAARCTLERNVLLDDKPLASVGLLLDEAQVTEKEGAAVGPIAVRQPTFQFRRVGARDERLTGERRVARPPYPPVLLPER